MGIKGVIFDMDGVILNNHQFHVDAWKQFIADHGKTITDEEFSANFNGRTTGQALKYLFPDITSEEIETLKEEKESLYRNLILPTLKETEGLTDFLKQLKEKGYKTAVATSAYPANVEFTLSKLGLHSYFDSILDETFVKHGKPDPEIYSKTIAALGLEPGECVVFEDSFSGIESGQRAGTEVIGVVGTETEENLKKVVKSTVLNFVNFEFSLLNKD
ncbi:HAD family phosphatase [Litoribacter alkaliphilus]|uniref:HAD family phosphatase n=1 Tax=Litoribacter ruber TaxID=702568 RepID=A0AAP2G1S4_9BACT|nr:HAD family phosphatase [Litoribacter alkaliphilus]MBS9525094.1 HAD family phosphatase [Litoribacter alkaliphilus]